MSETLRRYRFKVWLWLNMFIGGIGLAGTPVHDWTGSKAARALTSLIEECLRKRPTQNDDAAFLRKLKGRTG